MNTESVNTGGIPAVTWFIPCYNGMPYIRDAVESVLAQTLTDWECLLIDDGSRDGTWEYLQSLKDPRFRLYRTPCNLQVGTTGNMALALARGRYLARLDQDDLAHPQRLEKKFLFLEAHPEVTVCGTRAVLFGDLQAQTSLACDDAGIKARLLGGKGFLVNPSTLLRLDFVRRHGLCFDAAHPLSCDYGFWVDCMLQGAVFANLDEPLTSYRIHAAQGSRQVERMSEGVRRVRARLLTAWFPDLTGREILALELLVHDSRQLTFRMEDVRLGLAVCDRLLASPGPSRFGEDRGYVHAYLAHRRDFWLGMLERTAARVPEGRA